MNLNIEYQLKDLPKIASKIIQASSTKTLLFFGKMGVGKTTLIKEIVKQLGSADTVSSPTFSLVNEYQGKSSLIYHFDFYRIEEETEAFDIGFEEYLYSPHWKLIEWPEKIDNLLPERYTKITLQHTENTARQVYLENL